MVGPGGWETRINADNDVEWIPPPDLDTGQARINDFHRPERLHRPLDDEDQYGRESNCDNESRAGPEPGAA
jgi:hypothetical protein